MRALAWVLGSAAAALLACLVLPSAAAAPPDLAVQEVWVEPSQPGAGVGVVVRARIANEGFAPIIANTTVLFQVDGANLTAVLIPPTFQHGAQRVVQANWTAQPGTHTLRVEADPQDAIPEVSEGNNARTLQVDVPVPTPTAPDLAVAALTLSPPAPEEGDAVLVAAQVRNLGLAAGPFRVAFRLGGAALAVHELPGLARNATLDLSAAWNATFGSHALEVVADAASQVAESDESNNARTHALTVHASTRRPHVDLAVRDLAFAPLPPRAGQPLTFTAVVEHRGNLTSGPFRVAFVADGQPLGSAHVASLAPGASVNATSGPWTPPDAGLHRIEAFADADRALNESDESNNRLARSFGVSPAPGGAAPDLRPDALALRPEAPHEGQAVVFEVTVRRAGGATGPFAVAFLVDGAPLGRVAVAMAPDASEARVASPAWNATLGGHILRVVVDPDFEVGEGDESNNEAQRTFAVGPAPPRGTPDLRVLSVTLERPAPRPGERVAFTAEVRNAGDGAAPEVEVAFLLGDQHLGSVTLSGVPVDATVRVTSQPWTALPGPHTVRAVVDPAGRVAERDETDNEARAAFEVRAPQEPPKPAPAPAPLVPLALAALLAARRRRHRRR